MSKAPFELTLRHILLWPLWIYAGLMSLLVTVYLLLVLRSVYIDANMKSETAALGPMPNGFVYKKNSGPYGGKIITDAAGHIVVHENVKWVSWEGDTIYGRRIGISGMEDYSFRCVYGEDCSQSQHLRPVRMR